MEEPGLCRGASASKKYVFIKGSSELAGGREQPSTKGKVCDIHWGLVQFPVKNQTTARGLEKKLAERTTFTKSGVRRPSRNKPLLPFSPHSSVLIATDMLNERKLGVSQALITHCVTQISILTAKSGWKSPTLFWKPALNENEPENHGKFCFHYLHDLCYFLTAKRLRSQERNSDPQILVGDGMRSKC